MSEKLPSYEDFIEDESSLPSVDELIVENNLPSVDDYIDMSVGAGNTAVDTTPCSVEEEITEEQQQDLTEIIRLISDVRKDIPEIPEIKYYDSELESILEQIKEIPEVRYYDREIEAICEQIDSVKEEIKELPEPKYYDDQVASIEDRISNLPEVKYYDKEIEAICEQIDKVRSEIPKFPKWVNEVNEVPDFSWIGKTFSVIDDDFVKVGDKIQMIRDRIDREVQDITENIETKDFDNRVEINKVSDKLQETKEKILKEIKETVVRVWDHHHEFKNDDRLLKKQILSQFNTLKQRVDEEVKEFNRKNVEAKDLSKGYFDELANEISNLPKPKYYDENIRSLNKDIKKLNDYHNSNTTNITELYRIVEELKGKQEILKEELDEQNTPLAEPPDTDNEDPLTPIDQNFVTLDQLQKHYKLFVERVQYQLASIGGGGAGFIKDLDDVTFDQTIGQNKLLIYDGDGWVGIASTALLGDISESSGDFNVGRDLRVTGITTTPKLHVGVDTGVFGENLVVTGDARVTGILTIGTGSIVLDPDAKQLRGLDEVVIGTANTITIKQDDKGEIEFTDSGGQQKSVGIGTTVSVNTSGIITATTFVGDLTGDVTGNVSGTAGGLSGTPNITVGSIVATTGQFSGNVTVGGTLTYDDVTFLDSIGVATARSGLDVCAGSVTPVISLQAATTTLTTTNASNVDTFVAATFRSAQYQIQITQGSSYHVTTLNVLHDGSSVYLSEFGTIRTGAILATFDADINSGNVRVRATPASDSSTVFKITKTLTRV